MTWPQVLTPHMVLGVGMALGVFGIGLVVGALVLALAVRVARPRGCHARPLGHVAGRPEDEQWDIPYR